MQNRNFRFFHRFQATAKTPLLRPILLFKDYFHLYIVYIIYFKRIFSFLRRNFRPTRLSPTRFSLLFSYDLYLILCKYALKMHKNKNFCISIFSKILTISTNPAINVNFICQICNFLQTCFGELFCKTN